VLQVRPRKLRRKVRATSQSLLRQQARRSNPAAGPVFRIRPVLRGKHKQPTPPFRRRTFPARGWNAED
jgi:hypothetical protein